MKKLRSWLRSMRNRTRLEGDMDEELRLHIDLYAADLGKQGVPKDEAMRRARIEFGAVEARKEECRESLGLRLWDELRGDLRSAFRALRQSPVFTLVAVISLGLGIGANTAIFTLANEVLFKTMAVPHSERLRLFNWAKRPEMQIGHAWGMFLRGKEGEMVGNPFPYPLFRVMQRTQNVMEDLVAFKDVYQLGVTVDGEAEALEGILVSGNFYSGLRARVEAGRPINSADDNIGAVPVVVISDAYWSRRFGRSAEALGKTIDLNRVPVTIVGVNAPEFAGPKAGGTPEVFFPLALQQQVIPRPEGSLLSQNSFWWVLMIGRLRPGISEEAAQASLTAGFRAAFHTTMPEKKDSDMPRLELETGSRGLDIRTHDFQRPIYLLLAVAGMVLLIACANLANLLLARATVRQREISLRMAMGAGRSRIVRQILTEALSLALLGGVLGLTLGFAGRNWIPSLLGDSWRHGSQLDARFDWRVFLFAVAVTAATGLLFGLAPALRSAKADANAALKETSRMSTSRPKALFGKALVVFQVALSLLLVVAAGLFVRTLINLRTAPTGLNPEHIVMFQVTPPQSRYSPARMVILFQKITDGLTAVPGAQSVTSSSEPLLAQSMDDDCFRLPGKTAAARQNALTNYVGANFLPTFGIPVLSGRNLRPSDNQHAPNVMVINQKMATAYFPGKSAVGETIVSGCEGAGTPVEVVGVSADAKYSSIREEVPRTVFIPFLQVTRADNMPSMTFEIKTAASIGSMAARIRDVVRNVDKDLPVLDLRTQTEQIDATLSQERVFAMLTSGFGLLALLLASIGIFGVMAYTVSRRTNEIGIRMALGAQSRSVLSMVLRETSLLACVGIVIGLAAAFAATRVIASMLFGLKATDPVTFSAAAFLLLVVAILAALIPAWRAARVDPVNALRHE